MNHKEILAYLLIAIITFISLSFGLLTYLTPNFSIPQDIDPNLPTTPEITQSPQPNPQPSQPPSTFRGIFYVLIIIVVLILVYFLFTVLSNYFAQRANRKSKYGNRSKMDVQRRMLEDARTKAYEILQRGLDIQKYTPAFISAYIALDEGLEHFREIRRPKHITPKEYAFSVSPPVFQPSAFRIVSKYYDLRFGSAEAMELDLKQFKKSLDNLFIDEVPEEIKKDWQEKFDQQISEDYKTLIPRIIDHTKPRGRL